MGEIYAIFILELEFDTKTNTYVYFKPFIAHQKTNFRPVIIRIEHKNYLPLLGYRHKVNIEASTAVKVPDTDCMFSLIRSCLAS